MTATIQENNRIASSITPLSIAALEGVSKSYGAVKALNGISFDVRKGEVLALLGANGAGKTTSVKLLLGLCGPNQGTVRVFGGDPRDPANRQRTGAMLQVGRVPETLKVREHIDLFSSYYPRPLSVSETIAVAGLKGLENKLFGDLSGGQRQRLLFALAICGDPDLVFLDEPTVGLDVEARRGLWDQIRKLVKRGKTVLLTTHYLQEADMLADRVVVINKGSVIAEGTPAQIKLKNKGRRIRCVTALDLVSIRMIAGVLSVKEDRDAVELQVTEAEPVIRELLARDPALRGLEVSNAGLEDAFLALTQENNGNFNQSYGE